MVRAAANSSINSTNRDIISEISESIRAKTPDDRVSNRYILSKLINKTSFYIKRENDLFRLFDYDNI